MVSSRKQVRLTCCNVRIVRSSVLSAIAEMPRLVPCATSAAMSALTTALASGLHRRPRPRLTGHSLAAPDAERTHSVCRLPSGVARYGHAKGPGAPTDAAPLCLRARSGVHTTFIQKLSLTYYTHN